MTHNLPEPRRNVLTTPLSHGAPYFTGIELEPSANPGLALLWLHSRNRGGTLHTRLTADELTALINRATEIRDWLAAGGVMAGTEEDATGLDVGGRARRAAQLAAIAAEHGPQGGGA